MTKIGFRSPSVKRSITSRTTGRLTRTAKKALDPLYGKKGVGFMTNPEKSVKNSIYHKYTAGVSDLYRPNSDSQALHKGSKNLPEFTNITDTLASRESHYVSKDGRKYENEELNKLLSQGKSFTVKKPSGKILFASILFGVAIGTLIPTMLVASVGGDVLAPLMLVALMACAAFVLYLSFRKSDDYIIKPFNIEVTLSKEDFDVIRNNPIVFIQQSK